MPFYVRLGFRELPAEAWSDELRAIAQAEAASGLDPSRRVVLRCVLGGPDREHADSTT
jgi:hypothetical protein